MANKNIDINKLGAILAAETINEVALEYKATGFEVFSQIVQKTPFDTGQAMTNWNISTDKPDFTITKSTSGPNFTTEISTLTFPSIWISNGLDYVVALEDGRSWKQAPAGIINPALAAAMANRSK
jgi:hypothetical protein